MTRLIAQKSCIACHGPNGPVNNFTSTGRTPTAAAVIKQLRTSAANMPSFSATQVSDAEAMQIAEFLASQTTTAATTAASSLPRIGDPVSLPVLYAFGLLGALSLLAGLAARRKWPGQKGKAGAAK